jgi:hypothetical protein
MERTEWISYLPVIWYSAGSPNNVSPNDVSPKSAVTLFHLTTFPDSPSQALGDAPNAWLG